MGHSASSLHFKTGVLALAVEEEEGRRRRSRERTGGRIDIIVGNFEIFSKRDFSLHTVGRER